MDKKHFANKLGKNASENSRLLGSRRERKIPVCRIQKFNMKCEIERMEIIYTFYFFAFFEKVIKKLLTFCYW